MSRAVFMRPRAFTVIDSPNTVTGTLGSNIGNDHMGVVWRAQHPAGNFHYFVVDFGSDVAIDTVALLGLTGATSAWLIQVEVATAAQGPTFAGAGKYLYPIAPLLAGASMPTSGRGRSYWEKPAGGPATARYWRVWITTPANNTVVTIARAVFGVRAQPQHNFDFGAAFGVRDTGKLDWSARGVLLRRRGVKLRTAGLSFTRLYKDEIIANVRPLLELVGNTGPIFLLTDPDPDADRQNRIYFGPLIGDLGNIWAKANAGFQWQADIVDLEPIVGTG